MASDSQYAAVLEALAEDCGFATKHVVSRSGLKVGTTARANSANVSWLLSELEIMGYARKLDGEKPAAWVRTERGTKMMLRIQENERLRRR